MQSLRAPTLLSVFRILVFAVAILMFAHRFPVLLLLNLPGFMPPFLCNYFPFALSPPRLFLVFRFLALLLRFLLLIPCFYLEMR